MNAKIFLSAFTLICLFNSCTEKSKQDIDRVDSLKAKSKVIMAIFAHPDDETTIGPVLAKYGKENEVYLVVATDGSFGVTDHAGISAGDSLITIRTKETECASEKLGIKPPHFLDAQDGLGLNGHGNFYEEIPVLKESIKDKIEELKPTTIVTFGPDGDTGHPDHRLVGLLTTEILLREDWANEIDLYFFGWTKKQAAKFPKWNLGYVHENMLKTKIKFSAEDEEKAFASMRCHKSQFSEEEFKSWIAAEKEDTTNILHFRKFIPDNTERNAF
mgnify:CR=1 FL=1